MIINKLQVQAMINIVNKLINNKKITIIKNNQECGILICKIKKIKQNKYKIL